MARPLRLEFPGAVYHVTSRGNERRSIFRSDRDRRAFLGFLAETVRRFAWSVTAYVLMPNHYHLLVQTPEANLSRGMQWLNGSYAAWFNAAHERAGHLFQGRFHSFLIEKETYFDQVLRYVALNPVRAGMCVSPDQFKWSSYRATAGVETPPGWLDVVSALAPFGGECKVARERYRDFVESRDASKECLWNQVSAAIYLGSERWVERMRTIVESEPRSTDHPKKQRMIGRPSIQKVVATVARVAGESVEMLRAMHGGSLRGLVAWLGWHEGWVTLRAIAAALRLRSEGHISNLIRRCDRELGSNEILLGQLDGALAALRA